MSGGKISGNTSFYFGGGVYISSGTFTMSGGTIYGSNESPSTLNNSAYNGAAMYNFNGTARYSDGTAISSGSSVNTTITGR
jgi:hypothetical protein